MEVGGSLARLRKNLRLAIPVVKSAEPKKNERQKDEEAAGDAEVCKSLLKVLVFPMPTRAPYLGLPVIIPLEVTPGPLSLLLVASAPGACGNSESKANLRLCRAGPGNLHAGKCRLPACFPGRVKSWGDCR
jgi:hypothetical protein